MDDDLVKRTHLVKRTRERDDARAEARRLGRTVATLDQEIDRLRDFINTDGRNCPSNDTIDRVLSPGYTRHAS